MTLIVKYVNKKTKPAIVFLKIKVQILIMLYSLLCAIDQLIILDYSSILSTICIHIMYMYILSSIKKLIYLKTKSKMQENLFGIISIATSFSTHRLQYRCAIIICTAYKHYSYYIVFYVYVYICRKPPYLFLYLIPRVNNVKCVAHIVYIPHIMSQGLPHALRTISIVTRVNRRNIYMYMYGNTKVLLDILKMLTNMFTNIYKSNVEQLSKFLICYICKRTYYIYHNTFLLLRNMMCITQTNYKYFYDIIVMEIIFNFFICLILYNLEFSIILYATEHATHKLQQVQYYIEYQCYLSELSAIFLHGLSYTYTEYCAIYLRTIQTIIYIYFIPNYIAYS